MFSEYRASIPNELRISNVIPVDNLFEHRTSNANFHADFTSIARYSIVVSKLALLKTSNQSRFTNTHYLNQKVCTQHFLSCIDKTEIPS